MAILEILHHPDPRLRKVATEIPEVTEEIRTLAADMLETMYDAPGIGLAAPQINQAIRMIVVDISEDRSAPHVLINPVITDAGDLQLGQEGCLSVPGIYADIKRAEHIHVTALNQHGDTVNFDAEGLFAICIQHEIDHLDGKLFVDYLSKFKQQRIVKKLKKESKTAAL